MGDVADLLSNGGPLAPCITNFAPRQQQIKMAEWVDRVITDQDCLICEAGTGTGKTFAYLLPALLSEKRIVISTGTKNLQDQLFFKDLPIIRKAIASAKKIALLKGRANYLCLYRQQQLSEDPGVFSASEQLHQFELIRQWSSRTHCGDISELTEIPEDAAIWPLVTSTTDNCLGAECPNYEQCFVLQARKTAQSADIVVINHHLFCADLTLKEDGFGNLLPSADCFILDEAHQLPEIASNFFGFSLSARQLNALAKDAIVEYHQEAEDMSEIKAFADRLNQSVQELRLELGDTGRRSPWYEIENNDSVSSALDHVQSVLQDMEAILKEAAVRSQGLENCWHRSEELLQRLNDIKEGDQEKYVRWFETYRTGFRINLTPLDISETFRNHMQRLESAWVFTSATLAVNNDFDHFADQIGIDNAYQQHWLSPFDYPNQALLYIPEKMPAPSEENYTQIMLENALPVLEASAGRAFILFTSYRALHFAAEWLENRLAFPLFVQGRAPKVQLIHQFKQQGNAVLLGTSSFWEGVDVRGEALSCVIIDKLPFHSPGDPVNQARIESMKKRGGNPFWDFQIPRAVIALKQGVGRLIRDVSDRGVLMLCDPRIYRKSYGKTFLQSLPRMRRTRRLCDVVEFFGDKQMKSIYLRDDDSEKTVNLKAKNENISD